MKTLAILIILNFIALHNSAKADTDVPIATIINVHSESIDLSGIQDSIYSAFTEAFSTGNSSQLDDIQIGLEKLAKERDQSIITYWRAYLAYYKGIYLVTIDEKGKAEKIVDKHIGLLKKIKNKNSEEYALLSLLRGFSIQFKSFIRAPFISSKAGKDVEQALKLDPQNMRAKYVEASSDFYTPKNFGGGKKVEGLLLEALKLPEQKTPNPILPSWGRLQTYELLLQYYVREEKWTEANSTLVDAKALYPESRIVLQMEERIKEQQ